MSNSHQAQNVALRVIVVMGVAGAGKTTIGRALSDAVCWTFYDADDFHSKANIEKMRRGEPLTDEDRAPWLETLRGLVADVARRETHAVLACSALRESYREALLPEGLPAESIRYVFLDVSVDVLHERLHDRRHFFPPELIGSQLETLEKPQDAVWIDGTKSVEDIIRTIRTSLNV